MVNQTEKVGLRRLLSIPMLLTVVIIGAILTVVAIANTPAPAIPLYPGAHYIDRPWPSGNSKPDLFIVMEVSEHDASFVEETYSELLRQNGWGDKTTCLSGLPAEESWYHAGSGLLDFQGWLIEADYIQINDKIDIILRAWRGRRSMPCANF